MTVLIVAIAAFLVGALIFWMRSRDIGFTWYEWLIGIAAVILIVFSLVNFFGSMAEEESQAATMFLLITGLPGLVLAVVTWQLAARRLRA